MNIPRALLTLVFLAPLALADDPPKTDPNALPASPFAPLPDEAKQKRLDKIRQLNFDRRPSAILRAWSGEDERAEKKAADAAASATSSGKPTSPELITAAPVVSGTAMRIVTTRSIGLGGSVSISQHAVPAASIRAATVAVDEAVAAPGESAPAAEEAKTEDPAKAAAAEAAFDKDLKRFQRLVTLGDWPAVNAFLVGMIPEESEALYRRLLESLPNPSMDQPGMPPGMAQMQLQMAVSPDGRPLTERPTFAPADVIALADFSPIKKDKAIVAALGQILSLALDQGHAVDDFLTRAEAEATKPEGNGALSRRESAQLLMAANRAVEAGKFLPTVEQAEKDADREALNLLSRHFLALNARDGKTESLEQAWNVNRAVLAGDDGDPDQRTEALERAVSLAPRVRDELGKAWLDEGFADKPERGMEILAAIGGKAAQGIAAQPMDPDGRQKRLELLHSAVVALLASNPARAAEWAEGLTLLAQAWLAEAEFSERWDMSTSRGPRMQRDNYGNIYFMPMDGGIDPMMMQQNPNMPRPIPVGELLEFRPGDAWLAQVDESLRPKFATVYAKLLLKVGEDAEAFPYIERLAATHPDQAEDLADEFLTVWTRNHDPNAQRDFTNSYMFMFGFERRAEGIPMTRSKQERNLKELAEWVGRLRKLPIEAIDEDRLAKAFTACHSVAEVYKLEAIENVFGGLEDLKPKTLAALVQQMRSNLVSVWRQPAVQEQNKTRRRERDIRAEVQRGYRVASAVIARGLELHPDDWSLLMARAAIDSDANEYDHAAELSTDFVPRRKQALEGFKKAAEQYVAAAASIPEEEQSAEAFQHWFYAALGAADLAAIKAEHQPDPKQPALIKAVLDGMPAPLAERHRTFFANDLFTRMSNADPSVKFRYLKYGFEIVGDHPRAAEAKKVFDYYADLNSEIKLVARLDGPDSVGHGRPFGVFVELMHTTDIERESGGFGRYLQNQNTGNSYFYYNYGRPLENYREKFEKAAREALEEQFEVDSVVFQTEDVHSRATEQDGWRVTPYAYITLKARNPGVDQVPPVRLDLDFLDTSGYVVLPIESPTLAIDASSDKPGDRPFQNLKVTQTLDERQADEGKLILEVKATAQGLVPDLDSILAIDSPGLTIDKVEDQGLNVSRFDPESDDTVVVTERDWLVNLKVPEDAEVRPELFRFASNKVDVAETVYQRYVDADLEAVEAEVPLVEQYGESPARKWLAWAAGGLIALTLLMFAWRLRPRQAAKVADGFQVPEHLTPFTVLGLLRSIDQTATLDPTRRAELAGDIANLERHFFAAPDGGGPDLRELAETWVRRA